MVSHQPSRQEINYEFAFEVVSVLRVPPALAKEGNPLKVAFEISGNQKETKMTSIQNGDAKFPSKAEVFRIRKFMTYDTIIK